MRTLVIGADGLFGRHLMPLLEDGHAYKGDIRNVDALTAAVQARQPDVLVNLAGVFRGPRAEMMEVNADGAIMASRIASRFGATFVSIGSAAEYGAAPAEPIKETWPCRPKSAYGISKLRATLEIAKHGRVLRPSNVIGPFMSRNLLLGNVVAQLEAGASEVVVSSLHTIRDYVDVRDVVKAIQRVVTAEPGIYNVSSGIGTSTEALLSMIPTEFDILVSHALKARDEVDVFIADSSKLRSLGWQPTYALADSVRDTWEAR